MKNSIVTLNANDRALVISQAAQRVQLIDRFSEDVDLALSPAFFSIFPTTRSQRLNLRKESRKYMTNVLSAEITDQLNNMGIRDFEVVPVTRVTTKEGEVEIDSDKDPTVLQIKYRSVLNTSLQYVQSMVKLETSCLSMSEPTEVRLVSSIVAQQFPQIDYHQSHILGLFSGHYQVLSCRAPSSLDIHHTDKHCRRDPTVDIPVLPVDLFFISGKGGDVGCLSSLDNGIAIKRQRGAGLVT